MKIALSVEELKFLNKIDVLIKPEKDYREDEIESFLDEIYFNESTNVGYDNEAAKKYASIADKIESQRN